MAPAFKPVLTSLPDWERIGVSHGSKPKLIAGFRRSALEKMMKKSIAIVTLALFTCMGQPPYAQSLQKKFSDIQPELETILSDLSTHLSQFEEIQRRMDASGKANQDYNQQKNIFLSSMLAISTINSICEYEMDLLTLFIDLRDKNRLKFYGVRIESLETSVKQIEIMYRQIQVNYSIFPPNFFEAPLVRKERLAIQGSVTLLNRCIELLKSVQPKP